MRITIKSIELDKEAQDFVYDKMIELFDVNNSEIYSKRGQQIEFTLNESIEVRAVLELYQDNTDPDQNNQSDLISQSVIKFKFAFMIDGEQVKANDFNLDDRISKAFTL